ncbi:MAG: hypothetical protein PWP70_450 [Moorella sp. (in: firmicutes)]|nr:hypothetical protein [Moorella sp. (in: firmicutes)]
MNCCRCRELLSPYLDGILSETVCRTLEGHLRFCPTCREELEAMRQTIKIIHTWSEEELELPAGFAERLRSRLERERQPWYRRPGRSWVSLSAAAALIMVMAFTARADYLRSGPFNDFTSGREQVQSQALTASQQPAGKDTPATPLLTLPPVAPAVPPRQPAPEIKEEANQLPKAPARTTRVYRPALQEQKQEQEQKYLLVGAMNLSSRSRAGGPVAEEQSPTGAEQSPPPADKGQPAGQQPGTRDQAAGESPGKVPGSPGQAPVLPQPGTGLDTGGTSTGSSQGGAETKPSGITSPGQEGTLPPVPPTGGDGKKQPASTTGPQARPSSQKGELKALPPVLMGDLQAQPATTTKDKP